MVEGTVGAEQVSTVSPIGDVILHFESVKKRYNCRRRIIRRNPHQFQPHEAFLGPELPLDT